MECSFGYKHKDLIDNPDFPANSETAIRNLIEAGELEVIPFSRPKAVTEESVDLYIRNHQEFLDSVVPVKPDALKIFGGREKLYHLVREGFLEKKVKLNRSYITKKSIKAYEKFKKQFKKTL